jgi:hypothetical protein
VIDEGVEGGWTGGAIERLGARAGPTEDTEVDRSGADEGGGCGGGDARENAGRVNWGEAVEGGRESSAGGAFKDARSAPPDAKSTDGGEILFVGTCAGPARGMMMARTAPKRDLMRRSMRLPVLDSLSSLTTESPSAVIVTMDEYHDMTAWRWEPSSATGMNMRKSLCVLAC